MLRALDLMGVVSSIRRGLELEVLPALTPLSDEGVYSWKDIPYVTAGGGPGIATAGPAHEKQQLDVYIPAVPFPRKPLPVALFVHGGAWQRGDRQNRLNTYGNVGIGCARAGIVGVVMSYRLAPDWRHPEQVRDVASAVRWIQDNIHSFGGSKSDLFLCGHSAGAHLAMLAAAQPRWLREAGVTSDPADCVRGVIGISGIYNLVRLAQTPLGPYLVEPAFGKDPSDWRQASPVHYTGPHSALRSIPLLLVNAASDFHLEQDAEELHERLSQAPAPPAAEGQRGGATSRAPSVSRVVVEDRNHASIVATMGQPGDETTDVVARFVRRCVSSGAFGM